MLLVPLSLPAILAVDALHEYGGVPHHSGIAKHYWMLAVVVGALLVWLAIRVKRRWRGNSAVEPGKPTE